MKNNFCEDIIKNKKNIFVLAPMADVTDQVFREMISKYSRPAGPDIFWTEFVSADGLNSKGKKNLLQDLVFNKKKEYPILAQIFSSKSENILNTINLIHKLGFNGVDINMGCPDKSIEKQLSGSAMIKYPELSNEILFKSRELINNINKKSKNFFSFSVKTRIGYNKIEYEKWFPIILNNEPDIFSIHLRTRKELSLVPAHWELSKDIVLFIKKYCKQKNLKTPIIILNGDIKSIKEAEEKIKLSKANGIMIGRGIFGTPWFFNKKEFIKRKNQNIKTKKGRGNIIYRLEIMKEHTKLFEKRLSKIKSFNIMKKHYKAYVNGFDGAKELRIELMNSKNYKEVEKITNNFIKKIK